MQVASDLEHSLQQIKAIQLLKYAQPAGLLRIPIQHQLTTINCELFQVLHYKVCLKFVRLHYESELSLLTNI